MAEQLILKGTLEGHVRFCLPLPRRAFLVWAPGLMPLAGGKPVTADDKHHDSRRCMVATESADFGCRMAGSPAWLPPWRSTSNPKPTLDVAAASHSPITMLTWHLNLQPQHAPVRFA